MTIKGKDQLPYFKFYPRDFFEGTVSLDVDLKGPYALLLAILYMQGGSMPDIEQYIAGLLGCSIRRWRVIKRGLLEAGKIELIDGEITNSRARLEVGSALAQRRVNAENRSRPNKNKGLQSRNDHVPYPEPEPITPHATHSVFVAPAPKPTPTGTRLPSNWEPSQADLAYAQGQGLPSAVIEREAENFRDYWCARAGAGARKVDWAATWRTWIRKVGDKHQPSLALVNGGGYKPRPKGMVGVALELAAKYDRLERENGEPQ